MAIRKRRLQLGAVFLLRYHKFELFDDLEFLVTLYSFSHVARDYVNKRAASYPIIWCKQKVTFWGVAGVQNKKTSFPEIQ